MAQFSWHFLVLSLFALCAFADQKVGRLFVLNSTPELQFQQPSATILPENVAGLLSHAMGLSGLHPLPEKVTVPSGNSKQPKANLLVVVDGAPLNAQLSNDLEQSKLASFDIEGSPQESNQELLSRMFAGKKTGEESDQANVGDLLCQLHDNSLVLTLSTQSDLLESVSLHQQLLNQNPNWNAFRAHFDTKKSKLNFLGKPQGSLKAAIQDLFISSEIQEQNVLDLSGKPTFDASSSVDELFLVEMNALSQLLEVVQVPEVKALLNDASPDLIVFVSSSLRVLREKYGVDSSKYKTAWSRITFLLSQIQQKFGQAFNNEAVFEVLMIDAQHSSILARDRRAVQKRDYTNIASFCYPTLLACTNSTNSCNSNGNCTLVKTTKTGDCYRCKCASSHAGDKCEFYNIVAPFHIIFWLSLTLIIVLILIVLALGNMDPGTDTLLFRTASSRPKRD